MMRSVFCISLCIALAAVTGCKDAGLSADEKEERDPMVKTAAAHMEQSQWAEAERAFKDALEHNPGMARPHLDLAMIYQQYNQNFIHAIYHYDRYLELRPDSEKAAFIREQRNKVMRALEVQAISNSPEWQEAVAEVRRLRREIEALRKKAASTASAQPAPPTTPPPSTSPSDAASAPEAGSAQQHQIYTVAAGDTLTKIAAKFYGSGGSWEPIYEANRNSLSSPSSLRVGQTLVIPAAKK